jgi:hypothetical protein
MYCLVMWLICTPVEVIKGGGVGGSLIIYVTYTSTMKQHTTVTKLF